MQAIVLDLQWRRKEKKVEGNCFNFIEILDVGQVGDMSC